MDVDKIFRALGNPGRHHVVTFLLLCTNYFPVALNHLSMVIYGSAVPHHCAVPDGYNLSDAIPSTGTGSSMTMDSCHVYENYTSSSNQTMPCPNGWEYEPLPRERNIIMQFDLVCDRYYLSNVATTIYFLGVMLGGLVFGTLSDIYGRKPVFLSSLYLQAVVGMAIVFANNYITFVCLRFLLGFLLQGLHTCCYVLIMEQSLPEHRTYTGTIVEVFWGVGVLWLALISYALQDWRHIQLAISLPSLLSVVFIWLIPESVRWLVTHGRVSEAECILRMMAKRNGVTLSPALFDDTCNNSAELKSKLASEDECKTVRRYNVLDMFRTPQLRKRSFVLFYIWCVAAVCYYGLSMAITSLSGNTYMNLFMCGLVELPAYVTAIFILKWFGRRYPLCVYLMIGGSTCLAAAMVPEDAGLGWVRALLAVIGRAGVAGVFSVMILYSCELYPTVIRNLGVGTCAFWTRVGGVLAPQVLLLGNVWSRSVPLVIFGVLSLLGSAVALLLPETLGQPLADTIEEAEQMGDTAPEANLPETDLSLLEPLSASPMDTV